MFIIGRKPVLEYLKNNLRVEKVYILKNQDGKIIENIERECKKRKITVEYIEKKDIFQKVEKLNHQGVFIKTQDINFVSIDELIRRESYKNKSNILVVDKITDTHNFGAIIRTAEALGFNAVIARDKNNAPVNETVVKTSAGAVFYIPICFVPNLQNALTKLKDAGFFTYSSSDKAKDSITTVHKNDKNAIIIGNEEKGVSYMLHQNADFQVKIHLNGRTNSLNASVAAAIFMYEFSKK